MAARRFVRKVAPRFAETLARGPVLKGEPPEACAQAGRRGCLVGLSALVTGVLAGVAAPPAFGAGAAARSPAETEAQVLTATGVASEFPAADEAPALGTALSLPGVQRLDGRELPASHWKGKVVVIALWATWCPFCARQNPYLDTLHRSHEQQGLEVLALSIDRDPDTARTYLAERGYAFHAAMFNEDWRAAIGRPKGLPIVWVVGRDGRLAKFEVGELFPEDVAEFANLL